MVMNPMVEIVKNHQQQIQGTFVGENPSYPNISNKISGLKIAGFH